MTEAAAPSLAVDFDVAARVLELVRLDEGPHEYWVADEQIPGCTGAIEEVKIDDYSMIPPDIREPALERGRLAHIARHLDDEDDLDESSLSAEVLGHVKGWRAFRAETGFTPILSEQRLYIPRGNRRCLPCAGTLDALGIVSDPDRLVLADMKTGQKPKGVGPQTAGYALMLRELGIADCAERWCVCTRPDGKHKVHKLTAETDAAAFMAAVWLWWWKRGTLA